METKFESKLTKTIMKNVRKNSSGARQSPACKPSKSSRAGSRDSSGETNKAEKPKRSDETTTKKVSIKKSILKNGKEKQQKPNLDKKTRGN